MIKEIAEKQIRELYGKKSVFCAEVGHKHDGLHKKLKTLENQYKWVNDFLSPLNKKLSVIDKDNVDAI